MFRKLYHWTLSLAGHPRAEGALGAISFVESSFFPIPADVLFVPMCSSIGFSTPATILLISAAAALGDAGSPASDTTLGPTSGLNADGQHDHIRDTCIPTFIAFNIPIMICAILMSQVL